MEAVPLVNQPDLTPAAETLIHQLVIELHMQGANLACLEIHFDRSRVPQSVNPKLHPIRRKTDKAHT